MESQHRDGDQYEAGNDGTANCRPVSHSLRQNEIVADVETLTALGNETRYEALRLISRADDGVCVCHMEPTLGVSQSAISQAVSKLFDAGLVERRKEGRWRYYTTTDRAEKLVRILDETRKNGNDTA